MANICGQKSNLYKFTIIIVLWFSTIVSFSHCVLFDKVGKGNKMMDKKLYNFNMTNVNSFYHKAAISALIKSKVRKILKELPKVEEIIFWQCSKEAKKLNDLAKCAVTVFNVRDRLIDKNTFNQPKNKKYYGKKEIIYTANYSTLNIKKIKNGVKVFNTTNYNILKNRYNIRKKVFNKMKPIQTYNKNDLKYLKKIEIKNEFYKYRRVKKSIDYFKNNSNNVVINEEFLRQMEQLRQKEKNLPIHLRNLKRLERFNKMSEHVDKYVKRMNKHNEETISAYNNPMKIKMKKLNGIYKESQGFLDSVMEIVNDLLLQKHKFSFLSPRIFNIMPPCKNTDGEKCNNNKRLLSPTIFSFHEEDGYWAIPSLMKSVIDNDIEQNQWLNLILEISGASRALQKAVDQLKPQIEEMENKIFPSIINAERMEHKYNQVLKMHNKEQLNEMEEDGYTFLRQDQLSSLDNKIVNFPITPEILSMTKDDLETRLESVIRQLAILNNADNHYNDIWDKLFNNGSRQKRQTEQAPSTEDPEAKDEGKHNPFVTLEPFAFFNRIGEPVTLEIVTLSPHAFISEILSPEALTVQTLNPRAFVATVLSPNALIARILSPGFFRAEILSPRALTAWVLSPDFLFVEVLSPKFIEPRILSPEYLQIQILSPTFISPRVLSQEGLGVLVLSPNILSPNVLSRESLIVEILSPHILGGHEHTESGESAEGEFTGEHHTVDHVPHGHHSEFHAVHIHTYPFSHREIPHAPTHTDPENHFG
uniref:Exported protein n=1 Tax=Strongyloides papillosus TaxID=174720 RepID=A0A0N5BNJ4_STREA